MGHDDSRQMVWLKDTTCFNLYIFGEKPLSGSCGASLAYNLSCALSPLLHSVLKLRNKLALWLNHLILRKMVPTAFASPCTCIFLSPVPSSGQVHVGDIEAKRFTSSVHP